MHLQKKFEIERKSAQKMNDLQRKLETLTKTFESLKQKMKDCNNEKSTCSYKKKYLEKKVQNLIKLWNYNKIDPDSEQTEGIQTSLDSLNNIINENSEQQGFSKFSFEVFQSSYDICCGWKAPDFPNEEKEKDLIV